MKVGFYVENYDEDFLNFLSNINFEFLIFKKSENEKEKLYRNVRIFETRNIKQKIIETQTKIIFVEKNLELEKNDYILIKIVDNSFEKILFPKYENFAFRVEKSEIYFPYFIDFEFFSNYKNKMKKFEKFKRITIFCKSISFEFFELNRILVKELIKRKVIFQVYGLFDQNFANQKNFIFIRRNLSKEERAQLYYFSDLIICLDNFKKEVLEAMAMGKNVLTLDGFSNIKFDLHDKKLIKKIERFLNFSGINEFAKEYAKDFDIKNASKIFEKELKEKLPILIAKSL